MSAVIRTDDTCEVGEAIDGILERLRSVTTRPVLLDAHDDTIHVVLSHSPPAAGHDEHALLEELLAVALELRFPSRRLTVEGRD